jgi:alpha-glucosidase
MLVPSDLYLGTCILVHEFSHTILNLGLLEDERTKIGLAFEQARKLGRWKNTYAALNMDEYFAEAVTSYFNANQRPNIGVHNGVKTRAQLKDYDPEIYTLLVNIFPFK